MRVCRAKPEYAKQAAQLIYLSGRASLKYLLQPSAHYSVIGFIEQAFLQQQGQFGYHNHWCIRQQNQLQAIGSCWHSDLNQAFHQGTLNSLIAYYQPDDLLEVISRNQQLGCIIQPPQRQQLCIGHLAVTAEYRNRELGRHLVKHFANIAKQLGKTELIVDVGQSNRGAIAFYQKVGFTMIESKNINSLTGFLPHQRMALSVQSLI